MKETTTVISKSSRKSKQSNWSNKSNTTRTKNDVESIKVIEEKQDILDKTCTSVAEDFLEQK